MRPLYAYDFDKTLVPYDSFRIYLLHLLKLRPLTISGLLVFRKLKLISSCQLKAYITKMVERSRILQRDAKRFAYRIYYDVQVPIDMPKDAMVLLISASPSIYMKYIAEAATWFLLCSDYVGEKYIEMYGVTKAEALRKQYPATDYDYIYAASDSESDLCWMKEFKQYEILSK